MTHDPEHTPQPPEALKLKMGWRDDKSLLALCYVEYEDEPLIATSTPSSELLGMQEHPNVLHQHVLDCEVFASGTREEKIAAAQAWFERVRQTQPWIKRN